MTSFFSGGGPGGAGGRGGSLIISKCWLEL